jgi:hypothetical protein
MSEDQLREMLEQVRKLRHNKKRKQKQEQDEEGESKAEEEISVTSK